jgi:(E)-4-hydroxy-3-methyl-but-2-enyl pyrophosphate reductase
MYVKLAKTAGFCMGVRRAMNMVLETANKDKGPIYTYGPLIHNSQALAMLEARGIRSTTDLQEASQGTIVIRSHGATPEKRKELKASVAAVKDSTCPYVATASGTIKKYAAKGYDIVIVGDPKHPEVITHLGYAQGRGTVIASEADVEAYQPTSQRICLVSQTTQRMTLFHLMAEKLKGKVQDLEVHNTICDDTTERQTEVATLTKEVEALVVVGGKNSANTKHLAEIAESQGTPVTKIETEEDLDTSWLKPYTRIGVMAGASTPNWMIERVLDKIERTRGAREPYLRVAVFTLLRFLSKSNLFLALGAAAVSYAACRLQGIEPSLVFNFIAAFFVFGVHLLNHFTEPEIQRVNEPARHAFYIRHRSLLFILGIVSAVGTLLLSALLGWAPFVVVLLALALGVIYRIPIFPGSLAKLTRFRRLSEIPMSKDLFLALGWVFLTVLLPPFALAGRAVGVNALLAALFVFILAFSRSILYDLRDIQGDMIVGRDTIPIAIGKPRTQTLLAVLFSLLGLALIVIPILYGVRLVSALSLLMLIPTGYAGLTLYLYHRRRIVRGLSFEYAVDSVFLLAGAVAYLWHLLT